MFFGTAPCFLERDKFQYMFKYYHTVINTESHMTGHQFLSSPLGQRAQAFFGVMYFGFRFSLG